MLNLQSVVATGLFLIFVVLPADTTAQVLTGRTVAAGDNRPLSTVELKLLARSGEVVATAISNAEGVFRLSADSPGRYGLLAVGFGYDSVFVPDLELLSGDEVRVEVRLGPRPIDLPALEVLGSRGARDGLVSDYYRRLDQHRKTGRGTVLDRADLEFLSGLRAEVVVGRQRNVYQSREGGRVTTYLRRNGRYCVPAYYINGLKATPAALDIPVGSLQGVEIYRGNEHPEFSGCGVILLWTRRDWDQETQTLVTPRSPWRLVGIATGFLALILFGLR